MAVVQRVELDRAGLRQARVALAYGGLNFGYAVEGAAKRNCPVRGGYRSFQPNGPVGGTLRRSIHCVVYLDGQILLGERVDDNDNDVPTYAVDTTGVVVVIGTNSGYGEYVDQGTWKMPARPFMEEGLAEVRDQAPALITAGALRHLGA